MRIITSQEYINDETVAEKAEKLESLRGETSVTLPVWDTELTNDQGEDLYILADGHHTYTAAKELGLDVRYAIERHPEGLTGDTLLDVSWMGNDYRYIDSWEHVW